MGGGLLILKHRKGDLAICLITILSEEERGPPSSERMVIKHISRYPFLCFKIRRPPLAVWPDIYLHDNLENIREEINTSPILSGLSGRNFRAYIWCNVYFKNETTGSIRVAKMTTNAIRILPLQNIMSGLQTLVKDLGTRFQITKKILENSDRTYIYANRIKICVVANDGKRVRRTGRRQLIQKFKYYPWGCRGVRKV